MVRVRMACRSGFVDVDSESRPLVAPQRAVADFSDARKHFAHRIAEQMRLLNAEVRRSQAQMQLRGMADR